MRMFLVLYSAIFMIQKNIYIFEYKDFKNIFEIFFISNKMNRILITWLWIRTAQYMGNIPIILDCLDEIFGRI